MNELEKLVREAVGYLLEINQHANKENYLNYDQGRYDAFIMVLGWMKKLGLEK